MPNTKKLKPKTAALIFTGAPMPNGTDTVAMQEECQITKKTNKQNTAEVLLPKKINKGDNLRKKGEDIKMGSVIVKKNQRLKPADIAAIASTGIKKISVRRKVNVTLFSTGNEIINKKIKKNQQVEDANAPMLETLIKSSVVDFKFAGILPDNPSVIAKALTQTKADLIITTGGASMGEEDHINNVLTKKGMCYFRQIKVKPGRPMMFGKINQSFILALPGNPVAAMVCGLVYARYAILKLAGDDYVTMPQGYMLPANFVINNKKPNRREFLRGKVETKNNRTSVKKFGNTGSGIITSLRDSNGLIEINENITKIKKGDMVRFVPYSSFD